LLPATRFHWVLPHPKHVDLPPPPLVGLYATQSPCIFRPLPLCCTPPDCRRSLNLIVAFSPRRVTPTHHRHCLIALYHVLQPHLLVVWSTAQLPCIVSFIPLFSLWHPPPSSCRVLHRLIAARCLPSINGRVEWEKCEEREGGVSTGQNGCPRLYLES
jgi:hypothetical protein